MSLPASALHPKLRPGGPAAEPGERVHGTRLLRSSRRSIPELGAAEVHRCDSADVGTRIFDLPECRYTVAG